ncbi:MAG TPA: hypothetical protein VGC55_08425 [Dokdonella sp.]
MSGIVKRGSPFTHESHANYTAFGPACTGTRGHLRIFLALPRLSPAEETAAAFQKLPFPIVLLASSSVVGSASATALPANPDVAAAKVPAALRPACFQARAHDAGSACRLDRSGCARLPHSELKACFDADGAHFAGAGSEHFALQLASVGRGDHLTAMSPIRPIISSNRAAVPMPASNGCARCRRLRTRLRHHAR